jgi:hypothetical protein
VFNRIYSQFMNTYYKSPSTWTCRVICGRRRRRRRRQRRR